MGCTSSHDDIQCTVEEFIEGHTLPYADQWRTYGSQLKLTARTWRALLTHVSPYNLLGSSSFHRFCVRHEIPECDEEILMSFRIHVES
jgi:hypothetical protein